VCGKQALPPLILSKSRMRKRARTDLRGGRSAMVVPTATVIREPFQRFVSWSRNGVPEKYASGHSTYNALIEM